MTSLAVERFRDRASRVSQRRGVGDLLAYLGLLEDKAEIMKHPAAEEHDHDPRKRSSDAGKRTPISKKLRGELLSDGAAHSCTWCGFVSENPGDFDLDHKVPVKAGGKTVKANLAVACSMCNRSRGAQSAPAEGPAPWAERSRQRRWGPEETAQGMADAMRRVRSLGKHLPGQHDQKDHGNDEAKPDWMAGKDPPDWASSLADRVAEEFGGGRRPPIVMWSTGKNHDGRSTGSGSAPTRDFHPGETQWSTPARGWVKIGAQDGADDQENKFVLLHELAHWLTNDQHNARFQNKAAELYEWAGVPLKYAYEHEQDPHQRKWYERRGLDKGLLADPPALNDIIAKRSGGRGGKVYLAPGEDAPEGEHVVETPRGARYYVKGGGKAEERPAPARVAQETKKVNEAFERANDPGERPAWFGAFESTTPLTKAQKRKLQQRLVAEYGDHPDFKTVAQGLAQYTQGFFDPIQRVEAAIATDTLDELEANAEGYFGQDLDDGKSDPTMMIAAMADISDIYGNSTNKDVADWTDDDRALTRVSYVRAQELARQLQKAIAQAPERDEPLYRGIVLGRGLTNGVQGLTGGDEFLLPYSASFSRDMATAQKFAEGWYTKGRRRKLDPGQTPFLIKVDGKSRSINIDPFSTWDQQESLTNGRFRVKEVVTPEDAKRLERDTPWNERAAKKEADPLWGTPHMVIEQIETVGPSWKRGEGVSYRFPAEFVRRHNLNTYDREELSRIKYAKDTKIGKWKVQMGVDGLDREGSKANPANLKAALDEMGFDLEKTRHGWWVTERGDEDDDEAA